MANNLFGVRSTMNQLGLDDSKIGWDDKEGWVTYNGQKFIKPTSIGDDSRAYASMNDITSAYQNLNLPGGYSPVRSTMNDYGISNRDIGYSNGQVTYKNNPFLTPTTVVNGTSFAPKDSINKAFTTLRRTDPQLNAQTNVLEGQDAYNKAIKSNSVDEVIKRINEKISQPKTYAENPDIVNVLTQLKDLVNSENSYNYEQDPTYKAAVELAKSNASKATRDAEEELNARGLLTSSNAVNDLGQIQQNAQSQVNAIIPSVIQAAQQQRQGQVDNLSKLLGTLITRDTSNRQFDYNADQGNITNLMNLANLTQAQQDSVLKNIMSGITANQGILDSNRNYEIEQSKIELQKTKTKIDAALARTQEFGKVTTQEDADVLGIPVGSSNFAAIEAAANRQADMDKLQKQLDASAAESAADRASRERISSNELSARAAERAAQREQDSFNKDMKIWEMTGKAPDSVALKKYGVTAGTAWTGNALDQMQGIKAEQAKTEYDKQKKFEQDVENTKQLFSDTMKLDDNTAEAIAMILTNDNRASAIAKFNENKDALAKEGVDLATVEKAINIRYPDSAKWSMPSDSDYNSHRNTDLTTDYEKLNSYGNEIRTWLEETQKYAASGDKQAYNALQYFYKNFPNGNGNLEDKLQFVRDRAFSNRTMTLGGV